MTKCTQCISGECCGGDFDELRKQLAMIVAASKAVVESAQRHSRLDGPVEAAIDVLAATLEALE